MASGKTVNAVCVSVSVYVLSLLLLTNYFLTKCLGQTWFDTASFEEVRM